jgi:2,5-diketo-D-gluconate reductase B
MDQSRHHPIEVDSKNGLCKMQGIDYPIVGFGTYRLTGHNCTQAVKQAIKTGYRIIDTATFYKNFDGIAQALKGQDRRHFYLISKVWPDMHSPEDLRKDLTETLEGLQTEYLDAYFLHWPNSAIPIEHTLQAMEEARQEKRLRHIGLSNVSVNHLKRALEVGVPIAWVQVEMHPNFYDQAILDFCKEHAIAVQAWRPLDLGRVNDNETLVLLGRKYGKTPYQVALRWITQHGVVPLPGSEREDHIRENFEVTDFSLQKSEMEKIDQKAAKGSRYRLQEGRGLGFSDEFDFSYEQCWPRSQSFTQQEFDLF